MCEPSIRSKDVQNFTPQNSENGFKQKPVAKKNFDVRFRSLTAKAPEK